MYYFDNLCSINNHYLHHYAVRSILNYNLIFLFNRSNANDDLTTVRNILHTNMFLCLIVVQILFVFGIDQNKNKVKTRIDF